MKFSQPLYEIYDGYFGYDFNESANFSLKESQKLYLSKVILSGDVEAQNIFIDKYGSVATEFYKTVLQDGEDFISSPVKGLIPLTKELFDKYGDDIINFQNTEGRTALQMAAYYNSDNITNFLVKKGANLDLKSFAGESAIHMAVIRSNKKMVNLLLEEGASISCDEEFKKLLDICSSPSCSDIKELLIKYKDVDTVVNDRFARLDREKRFKEFWEISIDDDVSKAVNDSNIVKLRDFIDEAFYNNKKLVLTPNHLKAALLNKDDPMLRLLITYGVKLTRGDLKLIKEVDSLEHLGHIKRLRYCGFRLVNTQYKVKRNSAPKL